MRIPEGPVTIERHELLSLRRLPRGKALRCLHGRVWVTARGNGEDHVLRGGEQMAAAGLRRIVVYGMEDSSTVLLLDASIAARVHNSAGPSLRKAATTGPLASARR